MTNKYSIRLLDPGTIMAVWYRAGKLYKWQLSTGKLQGSWYEQLYRVIPFHESQIEQYKVQHAATVEYTQCQPKSLYQEYVSAWFTFYRSLAGVEPKFGPQEGKALKGIASYLEGVSAQPAEALALWQHILSSWQRLDAFTRAKPQLTFINSQLNTIIIQLKHGQTGSNKARSDADDLRRSI